nr:TRAP transporter substrate-binding protein [Halomonas lactosivorans]
MGAALAAETPDLSDPPPIEGETLEDAGSHTIRVGLGLAETSPLYISTEHFGEILSERTDGRIKVEVFPNSQLGDDAQMMEMLQTGSLDMTIPSTSPATTYVPELAVFDLPFLIPDRDAAVAVLQSDVALDLLDEFEGSGIKALAYHENGFRQLTNSEKAVASPDDIEGLTIRTMENPVQLSIWETLGASPTAMAFGEVFSAMEQGVIDGQENPFSTILTSNFHEVQDHASETRHVYTPFIIMMSERTWDTLDPSYQELVQEAAEQAAEYEIQLASEYDDWSREQLEEHGMEVTRLDEDQIAAFQDAVQPVYDEWEDEIGAELIEEIQAIVDDSADE